ncbi:MAG: hypothetical protein R3C19_02295 [Planctomycetaceae bacterium]
MPSPVHFSTRCWLIFVAFAFSVTSHSAIAQEQAGQDPATENPDAVAAAPDETETGAADDSVSKWDRLIFVPFRELQKVFDNQDASAVIPYAQYVELLQNYLDRQGGRLPAPDAIITKSEFTGVVEKDVVRIQAQFRISVLREQGWARVPLAFGDAAVGKVTAGDNNAILQGIGTGRYSLLLKGQGEHTVTIELLSTVRTSPEARSFRLSTPPVGISELSLTIPEPDQTVTINPVQVLLPTDGGNDQQTVVKASLGATEQIDVQWNPRAGTKPVMDLLTSVTNVSSVRIEPGLIQTTTSLDYEILRGELREVTILVPPDARIIDVVSGNGRIRSWNTEAVGTTHQQIRVELLTPATGRFQIDVQTERVPDGDTFQLVGKSPDSGVLAGVHADSVVRESGRIAVSIDPSLTMLVQEQSGMKRIDAAATLKEASAPGAQAWEFSGMTGRLIVRTKPVEPRLLVDQGMRLIFGDDDLRLVTRLTYNVERAGVFQLQLEFPEALTIDTVQADGMSEFNVDQDAGKLTLSLTEKRVGTVIVDITAHQPFDSTSDNVETTLPTITPVGVERETGRIAVFAPQYLNVITLDENTTGAFPAPAADPAAVGHAQRVSSWQYTQRPVNLVIKTSPRPAQLSASVATTATIDPDLMKISSVVRFDVRNAGIDTYLIAVPEAIAGDVRFRSLNASHVIQQRNKAAEAVDGLVTWTLILQDEVTGQVALAVDWEVPLQDMEADAAEQTLTLQPPQVKSPFDEDQADKRRVTLTQTKGEIRLLRHESLSIAAEAVGDTVEKIDVRELELTPQEGYLAFRYFSQPASATVTVRKHEVHEVVATVVSRAAVEIVTEKQRLAAYRARFRITSSERQRLRIDLPDGADLQAPLINGQRTTFEAAAGVQAAEGWDPYYINISREGTSDESFLLSFQFRCPIIEATVDASNPGEPTVLPYDKRGGTQVLRLPITGDSSGGTVVQETRVAVWTPDDVSQFDEPESWTIIGQQVWSWNPLRSSSTPRAAAELDDWVGDSGAASSDFARQGNVTVYRALGPQATIRIDWWKRPFLVGVLCGTLILVGFVLRRTSWENRITIVILACVALCVWALNDSHAAMQTLTASSPGLLAVAGMWLVGLVLGNHNHNQNHNQNHPAPPNPGPPPGTPASPRPMNPAPAAEKPLPPGTVVPSPEVRKAMDDLMGGGK